MLLIGFAQSLSGRPLVRFGVVISLMCLIVSWLTSGLYELPLSSGPTGTFFSDSSFDASILSPSISPFQTTLPRFNDVLRLQLPPHSAQRWGIIHKIFTHYNPGNPLTTGSEAADLAEDYAKNWETCERPEIINLDAPHITRAQKNHAAFVRRLPALSRAFTFPKKSRGIVTTAGGRLMPIMLVSLRMLRRTGCTLPVEVFIANFGDYEPKLCEKVLPSLNARCVLMADDILDIATPEGKPDLATYQIKPFAILMSSFNEVLFLDADNFPVTDPGAFFESEPFVKTGLIIWPDFWCASQSRFFYHITGLVETPNKERSSSESGQLLYDKSRHIEDLLLACYYGYWGPGLWYPLLSQGSKGEGDKETFLAAALVLNTTFYQARQPPAKLPEEGTPDFAIQQVNPADDYAVMKAGKAWRERQLPQAFIHHHYPKLNALEIRQADYAWAQDRHGRMWGTKAETVGMYGVDLEYEVWKAINYTACDLANMFKTWEGQNSSCDFVQEHIQLVFEQIDQVEEEEEEEEVESASEA